MQLFSSSSSPSHKPNFTIFSSSQNPNNSVNKLLFKSFPFKNQFSSPSLLSVPPCASQNSSPVLDHSQAIFGGTQPGHVNPKRDAVDSKDSFQKFLIVRRPVMDGSEVDQGDGGTENEDDEASLSSAIDAGLAEFAKKMPMFEPEKTDSNGTLDKPLTVNLDLALYKARSLGRKFQYQEAEKILQKCIYFWPEDGRPYVTLGKILTKQSKMSKARAVYEKGCQATQGENPYIWQCWAVLEKRMGNIRRARELFDAATVADKKHIAGWHGWAVLEIEQGNIKKARQLLAKGLKFCGGNEYIYQTLARLEVRASRFEQARYLFSQATKCNPKSCASWLAWAQLEVQQENNGAARILFEKAVQASPKNRFAWHVWGVFEANMGNIDLGRKLLKIGHLLNPRDPVLLQSLALLEYKHSTANHSRVLFRRASELDPRHQPVWFVRDFIFVPLLKNLLVFSHDIIYVLPQLKRWMLLKAPMNFLNQAWGWMEWKEGNIRAARDLYQKALSIDSTSESAARCLQAWGVLEQRAGNLSAARRLYRSSLSINSQSYVTWMTWAQFEEDQGNSVRAEEIRNLYFQQRTEVVDDASWVMGFLDVIDPTIESIKKLLKFDQVTERGMQSPEEVDLASENSMSPSLPSSDGSKVENNSVFDLDNFVKEKLSLDISKLDVMLENSASFASKRVTTSRKMWR